MALAYATLFCHKPPRNFDGVLLIGTQPDDPSVQNPTRSAALSDLDVR